VQRAAGLVPLVGRCSKDRTRVGCEEGGGRGTPVLKMGQFFKTSPPQNLCLVFQGTGDQWQKRDKPTIGLSQVRGGQDHLLTGKNLGGKKDTEDPGFVSLVYGAPKKNR